MYIQAMNKTQRYSGLLFTINIPPMHTTLKYGASWCICRQISVARDLLGKRESLLHAVLKSGRNTACRRLICSTKGTIEDE